MGVLMCHLQKGLGQYARRRGPTTKGLFFSFSVNVGKKYEPLKLIYSLGTQ